MNYLPYQVAKKLNTSSLNRTKKLNKSASDSIKTRKNSGLFSHNNSKCHSRNSSATKNNKSKGRQKNKNNLTVDKLLFL